ncbi:MAG: hypothetical protein HLX50_02650 [Alteromonadaceae bacterium]|nr:hypothetical protein [Alteromonadaceae bacterium]
MSGKFLARAAALSLAMLLAACGGGGDGSVTSGGNGNEDGTESEQQESVLALGTGSEASFQEGQMNLTATELSSGGTTRISFNVVDSNNRNNLYVGEEASVTLTSLCDNATLDSPITTTSGSISTTYTAGCSGVDTITARLDNGATATAIVNVANQNVDALEFVGASPEVIATDGNSDSTRSSVSTITFKLVDVNGAPVLDETVTFGLSSTVGGAALTETIVQTRNDGTAQTKINAGSVASVVSVTATYELPSGEKIQTTSDPVSISASIADTDSFSISVAENFLPNARFYDGQTVGITIRAADRNNNSINNTIVNFVTSGGAIANECTLSAGECSLQWVSQDPRPADTGVVAILARTTGEESFRDKNSDGKYTANEDLFSAKEGHDASEAFLDRNNNGARDPDEEYFDYNQDGAFNGENGIYDGTACSEESEQAGSCTNTVKEIFKLAHIYMASDRITITPSGPATYSPGTICFSISGDFTDSSGATIKGPPPGNTSVSFETTNGSIVGDNSFDTTTSYRTTPVEQCVIIEADDTSDSGTLSVKVTPPTPYSGPDFIETYTLTD